MSQADDESFNQQAEELAVLAQLQKAYTERHNNALRFAKGSGAAWNGLYMMGLAMNGLELIPFSSNITPRTYWVMAPAPVPEDPDAWPACYVAEMDAFAKVEYGF